jgi:pyrroline-5-carboxylate reductase
LVEGFNRANTAPVSIYNRTPNHARDLAGNFPALKVAEREEEFDSESCPLLLVVPGRAILEFPDDRIARWRLAGRVVVSCANGLPLQWLEERFPQIAWVKAVPTVAAAVGRSVTLMAKGVSTPDSNYRDIRRLFASIGSVVEASTDEEIDRLSVVTSCLPGILAAILDEFALTQGLGETEIRELLIESALAAMVWAKEQAVPLRQLVASVANPGGLTEGGVAAIRQYLPPVFAQLKEAMDRHAQQRRRRLTNPPHSE